MYVQCNQPGGNLKDEILGSPSETLIQLAWDGESPGEELAPIDGEESGSQCIPRDLGWMVISKRLVEKLKGTPGILKDGGHGC